MNDRTCAVEAPVWGWYWREVVVGGKWDGEELNSGLSRGPRKPEFQPSVKKLATKHVYLALYTELPQATQKINRLRKHAWTIMQEAMDGAHVHPCDEHSEDVKVRTLSEAHQKLYAALTDSAVPEGL